MASEAATGVVGSRVELDYKRCGGMRSKFVVTDRRCKYNHVPFETICAVLDSVAAELGVRGRPRSWSGL